MSIPPISNAPEGTLCIARPPDPSRRPCPLPFDVWQLVADHLPLRDLNSLTRVSNLPRQCVLNPYSLPPALSYELRRFPRQLDGRYSARTISWAIEAASLPPHICQLARIWQDVRTLKVLSNGKIVAESLGNGLLVWDFSQEQPTFIRLGHTGKIDSLAELSKDKIVVGSEDDRLRVWDLSQEQPTFIELERRTSRIHGLTALPNSKIIAWSEEGKPRVWDLSQEQPTFIELKGHRGGIYSVVVLPDGKIVAGSVGGRLWVWELSQGLIASIVELEGNMNYTISSLVVLPDGRIVAGEEAGGSGSGKLWVCDLSQEPPTSIELEGHRGWIGSLTMLPDGKVVAYSVTGAHEYGCELRVWDLSQEQPTSTVLQKYLSAGHALAVFPDGKIILNLRWSTLEAWDFPQQRNSTIDDLNKYCMGRIRHLATFPDDSRFVSTVIDGTLRVWGSVAHPEEILHLMLNGSFFPCKKELDALPKRIHKIFSYKWAAYDRIYPPSFDRNAFDRDAFDRDALRLRDIIKSILDYRTLQRVAADLSRFKKGNKTQRIHALAPSTREEFECLSDDVKKVVYAQIRCARRAAGPLPPHDKYGEQVFLMSATTEERLRAIQVAKAILNIPEDL